MAVGNVCTGATCVTNSDFAGQVVLVAADGTPGNPLTVTGTEDLTGAACTSATSCVAVGASSTNGVVVPLATQGGGSGGGDGAPANTAPPTVSGTAKAAARLTCSTGSWTNDPTGYAYQWYLNGTPIQGATSSTYVVQTGDEQLTLTCSVTASNSKGAGASVTTRKGATVPVPYVAKCPAATGKLSGTTLGLVRLGMARAQARRAYTKSSNRGKKYEDFFCLTPIGVRVGTARPSFPEVRQACHLGLYVERVLHGQWGTGGGDGRCGCQGPEATARSTLVSTTGISLPTVTRPRCSRCAAASSRRSGSARRASPTAPKPTRPSSRASAEVGAIPTRSAGAW